MTMRFFGDTALLTGRTMRHITRSLDTILTVAIMPIALMLIFVYVFGGAIRTGSHHYVNYLLPGILLITIGMGISYTAFRLFTDMKNGIFERFQSMPIARSSVLWAHVLTSVVANLISLVLVARHGHLPPQNRLGTLSPQTDPPAISVARCHTPPPRRPNVGRSAQLTRVARVRRGP
jgi:hypothetical protein